ncbi:MAG: chemotaxis protein CheW [Leptospira sp.]|nr:chemotaxis protein CheW [Leptospira sp.]
MNQERDWLFFKLRKRTYAILASDIYEILWLLPISETLLGGRAVFGTINKRGRNVQIFDLNLFWDREPETYNPDGQILLLDESYGFVIDEIVGVLKLPIPNFLPPKEIHGIWDEQVIHGDKVTFLDVKHFYPQDKYPLTNHYESDTIQKKQDWYKRSYMSLGAEWIETLEKRVLAEGREFVAEKTNEGLKPYSIVKVGEEQLAISLEHIVEFSDPILLTPAPNMSFLFSGFMNLRGDVLPVLSLQNFLNEGIGSKSFGKVVVIKSQDLSFGLFVDELIDVIYEKPENRLSSPTGAGSDGGGVLEGSFRIEEKFVSILNVSQLIKKAKVSL